MYVNNLVEGTTEEEVRSLFVDCGRVLRCVVVSRNDKHFAFVDMEDDEQARHAIVSVNGRSFKGTAHFRSPLSPSSSVVIFETDLTHSGLVD